MGGRSTWLRRSDLSAMMPLALLLGTDPLSQMGEGGTDTAATTVSRTQRPAVREALLLVSHLTQAAHKTAGTPRAIALAIRR